MTDQILEVMEQKPLPVPQFSETQLQPSRHPILALEYEAAVPSILQYDILLDGSDQQEDQLQKQADAPVAASPMYLKEEPPLDGQVLQHDHNAVHDVQRHDIISAAMG
jgi:hypothetical protein